MKAKRAVDDEGYLKPGDFQVGSFHGRELTTVTVRDNAEWRRELDERNARRIPIGFVAPAKPARSKPWPRVPRFDVVPRSRKRP